MFCHQFRLTITFYAEQGVADCQVSTMATVPVLTATALAVLFLAIVSDSVRKVVVMTTHVVHDSLICVIWNWCGNGLLFSHELQPVSGGRDEQLPPLRPSFY